MSLLVGIAAIALAILLGGLAAMFRGRHERAVPAVRMFAVVAATAVALLHLLPEAIAAVGWAALVPAVVGFAGPSVLERAFMPHHEHAREAPTTALAIGYAAVVAHQAGEGAAVATLARTGALSIAIVLSIAAHTLPLAMVVAMRVLEVRGGVGARRATALALGGVALATIAGALAGNVVGAARIESFEPWILALVAGLLLHALSHDVLGAPSTEPFARTIEAAAGLAGLVVALFGLADTWWIQRIPKELRIGGATFVALAIILRSVLRTRQPVASHGGSGHSRNPAPPGV